MTGPTTSPIGRPVTSGSAPRDAGRARSAERRRWWVVRTPIRAVTRVTADDLALACLLLGLLGCTIAGFSGQYGLPIGPDRVLWPLAILLQLTIATRRRLRVRAVHVLMVVFVFWVILSMVTFENVTSVAGFALLDRVVMPFVLFTMAPLFFATTQRRNVLLVTLWAIGVGLSVCALLELLAPGLIRPTYIVNPDIGHSHGRARGPFVDPEAMGVSLAVCGLASAVGASMVTGGRRVLAVLGTLGCFVGVALCLTRSVWAGAVTGVVVAVLSTPMRRYLPHLAAGAVGVAAVILAGVPGLAEAFMTRLEERRSVYDRLSSNEAAVSLLTERPLTGIGWRRFNPWGADWVRQADTYPLNNVVIEVHNVLLSRAAELGIPAAALLLAIWVAGPLRILRVRRLTGEAMRWRSLGLGAFTVWATVGLFGPLSHPFSNNLVWLVAGVAGACVLDAARAPTCARPGRPTRSPDPMNEPRSTAPQRLS